MSDAISCCCATSSLEFEELLDYSHPLRLAVDNGDLNMISLLMAYHSAMHHNMEHHVEFERCVMSAITDGKIREAMCLCEHMGVPLVVRVENGRGLRGLDDEGLSDPFCPRQHVRAAKGHQGQEAHAEPQLGGGPACSTTMARDSGLGDILEDSREDVHIHTLLAPNREREPSGTAQTQSEFHSMQSIQPLGVQRFTRGQKVRRGSLPSILPELLPALDEHPQQISRGVTDQYEDMLMSKLDTSAQLWIRFGVFDHAEGGAGLSRMMRSSVTDMTAELGDEELQCMGSYTLAISAKDDIEEFDSVGHIKKLHHNTDDEVDPGTISFRVFLNAVQVFKDVGGIQDLMDAADASKGPKLLKQRRVKSPKCSLH